MKGGESGGEGWGRGKRGGYTMVGPLRSRVIASFTARGGVGEGREEEVEGVVDVV